MPVEEEFGRDRQHLLRARVQEGGIAPGLGALQRGEQRLRGAARRPAAIDGRRVVDLVDLAGGDGACHFGQRVVEVLPGQTCIPFHPPAVLGSGLLVGPGQGLVEHGEPGQRALGRVHGQRHIESGCRLVTQVAHTPPARQRLRLHGVQHAAHFLCGIRHQVRARPSECAAQAGAPALGWREVDARGGLGGHGALSGCVTVRALGR